MDLVIPTHAVHCVFCKTDLPNRQAISEHELVCSAKPVLLQLWKRAREAARRHEYVAPWPATPLRLLIAEAAEEPDAPAPAIGRCPRCGEDRLVDWDRVMRRWICGVCSHYWK